MNRKKIREWFESMTIDDLIKTKPHSSPEGIISISEDDTLLAATDLIISFQISSILVLKSQKQHQKEGELEGENFLSLPMTDDQTIQNQHLNYSFLLHIMDILRFIFDNHDKKENNFDLLERTRVIELNKKEKEEENFIGSSKIDRMKRQDSLLDLVHHWINNSSIVLVDNDAIVSPMDLLHMIYVNISKLDDLLGDSSSELLLICQSCENSYCLVELTETGFIALGRLLYDNRGSVIGVKAIDTGILVGHLSPIDFLSKSNLAITFSSSSFCFNFIDSVSTDHGNVISHSSIRGLRRIGIKSKWIMEMMNSLQDPISILLKRIKGNDPVDFDAYTVHKFYTLGQLIGKLLLLEVHQLWILNAIGRPTGLVTIPEIIKYIYREIIHVSFPMTNFSSPSLDTLIKN